MRVAEFAAWFVELEPRPAGEPDGGNAAMIESRSELVKAADAPSVDGNERVYGDVENTGGLAQA
jgi:hypothetical protein